MTKTINCYHIIIHKIIFQQNNPFGYLKINEIENIQKNNNPPKQIITFKLK